MMNQVDVLIHHSDVERSNAWESQRGGEQSASVNEPFGMSPMSPAVWGLQQTSVCSSVNRPAPYERGCDQWAEEGFKSFN